MANTSRAPWRALSALTAVAVVASGLFAASPASADTSPATGVAETVSTDALPTVQVDGIVWSQVVVGNTVYVGGSFATARPAGAAAGVSTTPRANVLAYNLTTGELITTFVANTNAQVMSVAASPDGSRIYIGGSFTTVNGATRNRLAALDARTGAVISGFAPSFNATVDAIKVSGTTVYVGGAFTAVNKQTRSKAAAVSTVDGSVLPFAPVLGGRARAVTVSPDGSKVVYGGNFTTINGSTSPGYGLGAVDAITGATLPWAANTRVRNAGDKSAVYSLTSDADGVYGTGYDFGGGGTLEGAFRADWNGNLVWVEDCHGDTYSSAVLNGVVYTAGHAHYCSNVGSFPQTDPWTFQRGMAFTKGWNGNVNGGQTLGYASWEGVNAPDVLNWWPDFNTGDVSGASQGPWSVAAGTDYVVYGGEFTKVNNKGQQGLVRFAVTSIAPNDDGPRLGGSSWVPTLKSPAAGMVRINWLANYDRDNQHLSYKLIRDGLNSAPIYETTASSRIWFDRPTLSYVDRDVEPGSTHTYRLRAEDPWGNVSWGDPVSITVSAEGSISDYASTVLDDGAVNYWRLGEGSGTTVTDWAGLNDAKAGTGVTLGQTGAIAGDSNTAARFAGDGNGLVAASTAQQGPTTFALEAWFNTTSRTGGKVVGFGSSNTGNSGSYDRHIYLDGSGRIYFGVYPGSIQTVTSGTGYNDGQWHQVVASLSSAGMELYVDGARVAARTDVTTAQGYSGYWRIGGDNTWTGAPYLAGSIDDVAVYSSPLTAAQVRSHYALSGRTPSTPEAPTDTYGTTITASKPALYWRLNEVVGSSKAADYAGTGAVGVYSGGVTKQVAGIGSDPAASFGGADGVVSTSAATAAPATYSTEVWLKTTSTQGGQLTGFGTSPTGLSSTSDRQVYLQRDGRLAFSTSTANGNGKNVRTTTLATSAAYNDGKWHQVVATQSSAGMRLYVDGALKASNTVTTARTMNGYFRVGGDATGAGTASYVTATLDEAAVYTRALPAAEVLAHYQASGLVPLPNKAPTAAFTSAVTDLAVVLDAASSTDSDGTLASYDWSFGDGTTGTGVGVEHSYAKAGTYPVTLTVTDDDGATATRTADVTVTAPNAAPTAEFTATPDELDLAVDASASADSDGRIAAYAWDFGDGGTATGATAQHTYAAGGTYTVTLTLTDDRKATGTTTHAVTVTAPPPPADLARDGFSRTTTGGLGTAPIGGAWTVASTKANYAADGAAKFTVDAGATRTAYLDGVSSTATEVTGSVSLSARPTTGSAYVSVLGRRVGSDDYRLRAVVSGTGSVQLQLQRSGTTLTSATAAGLTVGSGDVLRFRVEVSGTSPTTIRAKVWKDGAVEPAAWQASTTDGTAILQQAGSIGIGGYLSASAVPTRTVVAFDDLWAGVPGATPQTPAEPELPANAAPTAAFTSSAAGLTATVDASASADADGSVTSYAWAFGDGTTGTGATATHTYAAAGAYPVTLTVTDDDGATAAVTRTVEVTAPVVVPPPVVDPPVPPVVTALASDDFTRTVASGWGAAELGGTWTNGTSSSTYTVMGDAARITSPIAGRDADAHLTGFTGTDLDVAATVVLETAPSGGGAYLSVIGRRVGTVDYRTRVVIAADGSVSIQLRQGAVTLVTQKVTGLAAVVGEPLRIRLQVTGTGTTALRAKVWSAAAPEPAAWQVSATDSTAALQQAGTTGVGQYLSGSATVLPFTVRYDDFVVTAAQ
ncbi:PKD domain-containing protein [Naasia sp. SYSU D00057]|uniref:PKD domain-containing protein n=1 Tax=Naasia sp. SYSU D00057 TaxID=2817380 RepID=UPI001B30A173|nr:PKD domain-containing protein [Naasia sp. SYSU D00057]